MPHVHAHYSLMRKFNNNGQINSENVKWPFDLSWNTVSSQHYADGYKQF